MNTSKDLIESCDLIPNSSGFLGYGATGCALMEHDGRIISVTSSFASMLDSAVETLFGQSVFDLMTLDGDLAAGHLLLEGQKMSVVLRSDGRSLWWSVCRIAPGTILGGYYIGTLSEGDETERFEGPVNHRESLAMLGGLTAEVAHEIAGPLNVIANNSELLLCEDGLTPDARQGLTSMRNEAFRLCSLLQDILGFARNSSLKIKGHDPVSLVKKSLELFRHQPCAKKISWQIQAEPDLPRVAADSDRLQQVFFNLFKNARDASPDCGEVVVLVRRHRAKRDSAGIEFVIADKGEGITPADLKYIFEPFFTTKPPGQGTGLGLAIARRILAAHQGSLRIASSPGDGTSATFLLPVFFDGETPSLGV